MDALPNLHAAVLHFPIVLIPLALACEALGLARPESVALERLPAVNWALAAAATSASYLGGRWAADGLLDVPPSAQLAISGHSDAAWLLLLGVVPVAALRLTAFLFGTRVRLGTRVVALLVGAALIFQLVNTADRGGALVYEHALGVQLPAPPPCPTCEPTPAGHDAASRWRTEPDGTAIWEPRPGDLGADRVVQVVGTVEEVDGGDLTLQAEGRTLILVPGLWTDVQVNATLHLIDFEGTLGIVHHLKDASTYSAFTVTTAGSAELSQVGETGITALHKASWTPTLDPLLSVSSAGTHLKGLVAGKTVNHGHAPAPPAGEVGC